MTPQEMGQLKQALQDLALAFNEPFSDDRLKIYLRVLDDVSFARAMQACNGWIAGDHAFFPKPGQLRILAGALPPDPRAPEALKARAEQAWQNLRNMETRYNRWALADALTEQVFRIMGGGYQLKWGFGNWDVVREEENKHREFVYTYCEMAKRVQGDLPPLPVATEIPALPAAGTRADYDDSPELEDRREDVKTLLAQLGEALSLPPPGVPERYLPADVSSKPLEYTPRLSPQEREARKTLLLRQAQSVMAHQLAEKEV